MAPADASRWMSQMKPKGPSDHGPKSLSSVTSADEGHLIAAFKRLVDSASGRRLAGMSKEESGGLSGSRSQQHEVGRM